jgi:phosphopantetheinyl transferase (holo-ACP synthase)
MIGNDVIDLRDPETRGESIHPRFDERVLAPSERRWLAGREEPERDRWALWAAKEAAFKAARRIDASTPFFPARFVVEWEEGARQARVTHGADRFDVVLDVSDDAIHAVASLVAAAPAPIVAKAARVVADDLSSAARRLAVVTVCARLGRDSFRVGMNGRLPELLEADEPPIPLSLSHHGRVVGFAAVLP